MPDLELSQALRIVQHGAWTDNFNEVRAALAVICRHDFQGLGFDDLIRIKNLVDDKIAKELKGNVVLEIGKFYQDNRGNTWYCARKHTGHGLFYSCYYYYNSGDSFDRRAYEGFDSDGSITFNDYYNVKNTSLILVKEVECPIRLRNVDIESLIEGYY